MTDIDYARLAAELAPLVADALVARGIGGTRSELMTRDDLARALRVAPQTIDRMRRAGMPNEYIGDLPRFDLAACRSWAAEQATTSHRVRPPPVVKASEDLGPVRRISKRSL